jgi:hypothetical protein
MKEDMGEGFCEKVGFLQKPWQALFDENPNFATLTPLILSNFIETACFVLTKFRKILA